MREDTFRETLCNELCRLGFDPNTAVELSRGYTGMEALFEKGGNKKERLAREKWDYIRLLPDGFFADDHDPVALWNGLISEVKLHLPVGGDL